MLELNIHPAEPGENVRSYVYRMLEDNIMSIHLPPGTAMSEQEAADLLKISRTPVREAFIHLSQDGLLDILPQRGTFVAKLDMDMIRQARFMRVVLEEAVLERASRSFPDEALEDLEDILLKQRQLAVAGDKRGFFAADNEFHYTIFAWCGCPHIWQTLMKASRDYFRARMLHAFLEPKDIPIGLHEKMVQAIQDHHTADAIRLVHEHIDSFEDALVTLQHVYPAYFK